LVHDFFFSVSFLFRFFEEENNNINQ